MNVSPLTDSTSSRRCKRGQSRSTSPNSLEQDVQAMRDALTRASQFLLVKQTTATAATRGMGVPSLVASSSSQWCHQSRDAGDGGCVAQEGVPRMSYSVRRGDNVRQNDDEDGRHVAEVFSKRHTSSSPPPALSSSDLVSSSHPAYSYCSYTSLSSAPPRDGRPYAYGLTGTSLPASYSGWGSLYSPAVDGKTLHESADEAERYAEEQPQRGGEMGCCPTAGRKATHGVRVVKESGDVLLDSGCSLMDLERRMASASNFLAVQQERQERRTSLPKCTSGSHLLTVTSTARPSSNPSRGMQPRTNTGVGDSSPTGTTTVTATTGVKTLPLDLRGKGVVTYKRRRTPSTPPPTAPSLRCRGLSVSPPVMMEIERAKGTLQRLWTQYGSTPSTPPLRQHPRTPSPLQCTNEETSGWGTKKRQSTPPSPLSLTEPQVKDEYRRTTEAEAVEWGRRSLSEEISRISGDEAEEGKPDVCAGRTLPLSTPPSPSVADDEDCRTIMASAAMAEECAILSQLTPLPLRRKAAAAVPFHPTEEIPVQDTKKGRNPSALSRFPSLGEPAPRVKRRTEATLLPPTQADDAVRVLQCAECTTTTSRTPSPMPLVCRREPLKDGRGPLSSLLPSPTASAPLRRATPEPWNTRPLDEALDEEESLLIDMSGLGRGSFWSSAGSCPRAVDRDRGVTTRSLPTGFLQPRGEVSPAAPLQLQKDRSDGDVEREEEKEVGVCTPLSRKDPNQEDEPLPKARPSDRVQKDRSLPTSARFTATNTSGSMAKTVENEDVYPMPHHHPQQRSCRPSPLLWHRKRAEKESEARERSPCSRADPTTEDSTRFHPPSHPLPATGVERASSALLEGVVLSVVGDGPLRTASSRSLSFPSAPHAAMMPHSVVTSVMCGRCLKGEGEGVLDSACTAPPTALPPPPPAALLQSESDGRRDEMSRKGGNKVPSPSSVTPPRIAFISGRGSPPQEQLDCERQEEDRRCQRTRKDMDVLSESSAAIASAMAFLKSTSQAG